MKYAHLHRRAYSLPKHLTLADIVVGVVGFEPTQPEGTPLNNGINKTQTQSRSLNVSEYKDSVIFRLYKVNNVKFCNNRICYDIP
nr:MAG TPA: hypothetical protein [Caudoviricetes sp.]